MRRRFERFAGDIPAALLELDAADLVGLTVDDATAAVLAAGGLARVIEEHQRTMSADFNALRVNRFIVDGVVASADGLY